MPSPYASLEQLVAGKNIPAQVAPWLQLVWDAAYNAGIDASKYAIDSYLDTLRAARADKLEIGAVGELASLLPLYRKLAAPPATGAAATSRDDSRGLT